MCFVPIEGDATKSSVARYLAFDPVDQDIVNKKNDLSPGSLPEEFNLNNQNSHRGQEKKDSRTPVSFHKEVHS